MLNTRHSLRPPFSGRRNDRAKLGRDSRREIAARCAFRCLTFGRRAVRYIFHEEARQFVGSIDRGRQASEGEDRHVAERIRLSVADARELAEGALRGIGYDDDEARIVADHVMDAALCGYEYSGLPKILNLPESRNFRMPRRPIKVLRETDISLAMDGGNNTGMLALFHAAEATISKARRMAWRWSR